MKDDLGPVVDEYLLQRWPIANIDAHEISLGCRRLMQVGFATRAQIVDDQYVRTGV